MLTLVIEMLGWMSKDKNSMLQVLILSMISEGSYTTSEIVGTLTQGLGEYSPQPGTIYPAIHQLVKKGYLIKSETRPMRVRISERGTRRTVEGSGSGACFLLQHQHAGGSGGV